MADSIAPLTEDLVGHARGIDAGTGRDDDPLLAWFDPHSAQEARNIERAIRHVLAASAVPCRQSVEHLDGISALAAFFYVALFDAVRSNLGAFVGTNPTWIKTPSAVQASLASGGLYASFRHASDVLTQKLRVQQPSDPTSQATVDLATSSAMPIGDASATAIITSPPYCTRIDYVIATRPELAVLGLSSEAVRSLRSQMIGTPTVAAEVPPPNPAWGPAANTLITRVAAHPSRASGTYYRKYFLQYLASMWQSFSELHRVLSPHGHAVIVVQDSFYKDVQVDLARIFIEMGESVGFALQARHDFVVTSTKAAINRKARAWRSAFAATESILRFSKE